VQCTNFSVASGQTLTVPSGTVIHATGTVTITGTLTVGDGSVAAGGGLGWVAFQATQSLNSGASQGIAFSSFGLRKLLKPGPLGGGPGGTFTGYGGIGGGSVVIVASGAISITGTINANGSNGSGDSNNFAIGGGGGGIVILASKTSISNTGTINAKGGNGFPASSGNVSPSGGGGGGLIHFLSPSNTVGTATVTGGSGGTGSDVDTGAFGGGAGAGNGGDSGYAHSGTAQAGSAGKVFNTTVTDPATLLVP
jgi:hypothetical protein